MRAFPINDFIRLWEQLKLEERSQIISVALGETCQFLAGYQWLELSPRVRDSIRQPLISEYAADLEA